MSRSEQKLEKDPFLVLGKIARLNSFCIGFGIVEYFKVIKYLIYLMSALAILSIPQLLIYSSYEGVYQHSDSILNKFTLGNLGGAESVCLQIPLHVDD